MPQIKDQHIREIKELIGVFKFERITYLCITIVSLIILLVVAIIFLFTDKKDIALGIALFAPSGAIAYTAGRLLKMWTDSIQYLGKFSSEKGDDKDE